ncbi:MAG: hypothetical protein H6718_07935 [Polyangiaceae bacterium]|nr:hypothetical protein [Myxococcales bacterium]MCB9585312.1 hypothetical protein [Polyangiaceae bacterium]MCB9606671.1 hypothetical protein [Polyangiaceae bacterium]
MKWLLSLALAVCVLGAPALAAAQWQEPGATNGWGNDAPPSGWGTPSNGWGQPGSERELTPAEPEMETVSYGWQTLTADGLTAVATVTTGGVGAVGYFFAVPIIHLAHGRAGAALASFGFRSVLPIGFALGAIALDNGGDHGYGPPLLGAIAGVATAIALDAAWLARETRPKREPPKAASAPLLQVSQHSAMGGWQGTF